MDVKSAFNKILAIKWGPTLTWLISFSLAALFLHIEGKGDVSRLKLTLSLATSAFAIGSLGGFLFSSYGEETATIGKVRDWVIGGITGLTIAKAGSIKSLLTAFAVSAGPQEFAVVAGEAIAFCTLGFFFMFFQRELIFNVLLAASRAQRGKLDGTKQAEVVTTQAIVSLPPTLLSGIEDLDDLLDGGKPEAQRIEEMLSSDDVIQFLKEADDAVASGETLDWDIVSKAAHLNYYKTYATKGDDKQSQAATAAKWLLRALMINPKHADFTAKYADIMGLQKQYGRATALLENLYASPDAPAYIEQWLGYFLLFVDREEDAIRLSEDYHRRFPDGEGALLNAACGYAQLYAKELRSANVQSLPESANRIMALARLEQAIKQAPPGFASTVVAKYTTEEESFFALRDDPGFISIVGTVSPPQSVPKVVTS